LPGPRDPTLTPYVIAFERGFHDPRYRRVVWATAAQTAKTEGLLDVIGHRLDQKPLPILYVGPNKEFLETQFEPRLMALLDEAPSLAAKVQRGKRMRKTLKRVAGVPVRLAHAGSSTALKSDPAGLALIDEFDEMAANVKGQGDPLGLVEARGITYAEFTTGITSTPSRGAVEIVADDASGLEFWAVADLEDVQSPIWRLWQEGTRYHWCWPCPVCGDYFVPRLKQLRWPKDATPAQAKRKAWLECPRCGGVIEEEHKKDLNARGVYVAPGQSVTASGEVVGEPPDTSTLSFWTSGLVSPFVSFGQRAEAYLTAVRSAETDKIQTAVNAGFGECYLPGGGDLPPWQELRRLKRPYKPRTLPAGVVLITAGVDVQQDRLVVVARGWGSRGRSWLVDHTEILGDTADVAVWHQLDEYLADPVEGLPIKVMFVDSGFRPGKKDQVPEHRVYEFCRRHRRSVFPTKGLATARLPLRPSKIEVRPHPAGAVQAKYGLTLYLLDTDHWKSFVHERLHYSEDAPGAWVVHAETTDEYFRQIVSEARVRKPSGSGFQWVAHSHDNHALDCEAMAAAAGFLLGVQRLRERPDEVDTATAPKRAAPAASRTVSAEPRSVAAPAPAAPAAASPAPAARGKFDRFGHFGQKLNR
jgi:phage terminase large subunit GpA-like protein